MTLREYGADAVFRRVPRFTDIHTGRSSMTCRIFTFSLCGIAVLTVSGCFPGGDTYSPSDPAGFFSGVWHGWIAPISLIVGLFKDGIRIYEPHNSGWWYDLGFYVAVIAGFGGIALFRRDRKHRRT